MDAQLLADDFIETFKPDLNRYVVKDSSGNVKTVKYPLTKELMIRFFGDTSSCRLSFFVKGAYRNYIGLDIDDHNDCGGWEGNEPSDFLCKKFAYVKSVINQEPSLVFRSPRGIHVFWFLTESLPNLLIEELLKARLFEVEILPTRNHALAIPRPAEFLDSRLNPAIFLGYSKIVAYDPKDIFGEDCTPDAIKRKYKSEKTAGSKGGTNNGGLVPLKSLEEAEAKHLPIKNGQSNEAYKSLVALYVARGLNPGQIVERFKELVKNSPGYTGDLLSDIGNKVASSFRNLKGTMGTLEMGSLSALQGEPKIKKLIEEILDLEGLYSPKGAHMRDPHTIFLLNIISWMRAIDRIMGNPERAEYWGHLYPHTLQSYKQGKYYPLPYSKLKIWSGHYNEHLALLKEHGILEESPYGYSTSLKRCKHYRLTRDISSA